MRVFAIIAFLLSNTTFAQMNGDWIESGPLKLRVNADGQIATFNNMAASEINSGSNNHIFKFINMWISGYDTANKLYITSVNGFTNKSDYSPGPIDSLSFAGAEPSAWNFVWSVADDEIYSHRKNFRSASYQMPESIKNWPSNGSGKFNKYLAPFIDYDANGKYNPESGDYPDIKGNKCSYFIVNDNYSEHKASGGAPLKLEIYGMAYSLNQLPNTVFVKYYLVNRTNKDYHDLKVSFHTGFQLGYDGDNYCGTLVTENTIFAYNGDLNDENHFGNSRPLGSLMILSTNLTSTLALQSDTNLISGMPATPFQHRLVMDGKWKSNIPLTYGAEGTSNNLPANFIYPGLSDKAFSGQNWEESSTPGMRSMLANLSYSDLKAKGYLDIDIAISGYEKSDELPYKFLATKAIEIKDLWVKSSAKTKLAIQEKYLLKNPIFVGETLNHFWFDFFEKISVYTMQGKLLEAYNPRLKNQLIFENAGIYYLRFESDNQMFIKKILVY